MIISINSIFNKIKILQRTDKHLHYVQVQKWSLLCLVAPKEFGKEETDWLKNNSVPFKPWSMEGRQPFSFLNSPVASCDVKHSVFCSTKDICL